MGRLPLTLWLISLAFVVRILFLDKGYSGDEGALLRYTQSDWHKILHILIHEAIFPPLTPIFLSLWKEISVSEIWIRMYFVLFGVGSCFLIYRIALLSGNRRFSSIAFLTSLLAPQRFAFS